MFVGFFFIRSNIVKMKKKRINKNDLIHLFIKQKFINIIVDKSHLIKSAIYTGLTHHVIKTRCDVTRAAAASQLPVQHGWPVSSGATDSRPHLVVHF